LTGNRTKHDQGRRQKNFATKNKKRKIVKKMEKIALSSSSRGAAEKRPKSSKKDRKIALLKVPYIKL